MEYSDIVGKRIGIMTVGKMVEQRRYGTRFRYFYEVKCDCGKDTIKERTNLIKEHTKSCGCLRSRSAAKSPCWSGHGEISARHWTSIKRHAINRKKPFTVTLADAWELYERQNGRCALTDMELSLRSEKHNGHYHWARTASLDRIDNELGYVKGNLQWVHKDVNKMKLDFGLARFIEICKKVANHAG